MQNLFRYSYNTLFINCCHEAEPPVNLNSRTFHLNAPNLVAIVVRFSELAGMRSL